MSKKDHGTFCPVKNIPKNHRKYQLYLTCRETLGAGDLRSAVRLPIGQSLDDWLALNVIEFFNGLSVLYGPISEHCTKQTCPQMTAGPLYKYKWQDDKKCKKAKMVCARKYIRNVFLWMDGYLDDPKWFPEDESVPFPPDFREVVARMFQRMFRIYAHIYHHHRKEVQELQMSACLNTSFKHFYLFSKEFSLIPAEQLAPLQTIIVEFDK